MGKFSHVKVKIQEYIFLDACIGNLDARDRNKLAHSGTMGFFRLVKHPCCQRHFVFLEHITQVPVLGNFLLDRFHNLLRLCRGNCVARCVLNMIINAERASAGVSSLSLSSDTEAYRISKILAADMANENHTDYDSPLYGTLDVMCNTFGVNSTAPVEVLWKTNADKSAQAIASRLQIIGNGAFVKASYNSVGISIVSKNGYYYINAILL